MSSSFLSTIVLMVRKPHPDRTRLRKPTTTKCDGIALHGDRSMEKTCSPHGIWKQRFRATYPLGSPAFSSGNRAFSQGLPLPVTSASTSSTRRARSSRLKDLRRIVMPLSMVPWQAIIPSVLPDMKSTFIPGRRGTAQILAFCAVLRLGFPSSEDPIRWIADKLETVLLTRCTGPFHTRNAGLPSELLARGHKKDFYDSAFLQRGGARAEEAMRADIFGKRERFEGFSRRVCSPNL